MYFVIFLSQVGLVEDYFELIVVMASHSSMSLLVTASEMIRNGLPPLYDLTNKKNADFVSEAKRICVNINRYSKITNNSQCFFCSSKTILLT